MVISIRKIEYAQTINEAIKMAKDILASSLVSGLIFLQLQEKYLDYCIWQMKAPLNSQKSSCMKCKNNVKRRGIATNLLLS